MKKFNEVDIYSVGGEPIVGGRLSDWMAQLMKNQNEIIDWIEKSHPKSYKEWAEGAQMKSRYLNFNEIGRSLTGKTVRIQITSKTGIILGIVSWHGQWRKYCFFPANDIVLDEYCMADIILCIVKATDTHKETMKEKADRLFG